MYQTFNISMTGLPICWFGVFDWQYSKQQLLENSFFYKLGMKNRGFNAYIYWRWYAYAVWQSFVILYFTYSTLSNVIGEYKNRAIYGSLSLNGTFIIETICILVNIKVLMATTSHNFFSLFCIVIGLIAFYG